MSALTDLGHDAASYREQVLDSLAESLFGVDMALEIVIHMPDADNFSIEHDLRQIFDHINRLMAKLSN